MTVEHVTKNDPKVLDQIHQFCVQQFNPKFLCSLYPPYPSRNQLNEHAELGHLWVDRDDQSNVVGLLVSIDAVKGAGEVIYSLTADADHKWGETTALIFAEAKKAGVLLHADPKRQSVRDALIAAGMKDNGGPIEPASAAAIIK